MNYLTQVDTSLYTDLMHEMKDLINISPRAVKILEEKLNNIPKESKIPNPNTETNTRNNSNKDENIMSANF
jgi:hypothetical protein